MSALAHHVRAAGDGADRPEGLVHQYVYVARSRRSGGLSLGVDLTPQGFCSFSCVYCQASHPPLRRPDLTVQLGQLEQELGARLRSADAAALKDLVLAGSGEPTAVPNFAEALASIERVCSQQSFTQPRRTFSNGRHLSKTEVFSALCAWMQHGGEVWIKLDGATADTIATINRRRFDVSTHLAHIWRLAAQHPVGIQTLVVEGPQLPKPEAVVHEVTDALAAGLSSGAKLREIHLLTLSRVPSEAEQAAALKPVEAAELERLGQAMARRLGLTVRVYPAQV